MCLDADATRAGQQTKEIPLWFFDNHATLPIANRSKSLKLSAFQTKWKGFDDMGRKNDNAN